MIELKPERLLSSDRIILQDGSEIGKFKFRWWTSEGELTLGGREYRLQESGWWNVLSELLENGSVVATGKRARSWSARWVITHQGQEYFLKPRSWGSSEFLVFLKEREVGAVRNSWLSRTYELNFAPEVPIPLQLLCFYMVYRHHARSAAAATTTSS